MSNPEMPSAEHEQFDEICSEVADFEPLPTVKIETAEEPLAPTPEAHDQSLDGLILAGLVAPY
jgi:hypothetical protein